MQFLPDYEPRLVDHEGDMSKRWYIDYRIWNTDLQDFVRKQYTGMNKYHTLTERRKYANKKLREIKQLINDGYTAGKAVDPLPGFNLQRCTVEDAADFVVQAKSGTWSRRMKEHNESIARRLKEYPIGKRLLRLASPADVQAYMMALQKDRKIGSKAYNNYLNSLSAFFNYFVRLDLLPKNPARNLQRQSVEKSEQHYPYTDKQRQSIKEAIIKRGELQLLLFINFVYYTCIRLGEELRLLRVSELRTDTIYIPSDRAKNNKGEHIAIPPALELMIKEYELRSYPADFYVFGSTGKPGPVAHGKNYFKRRHNLVLEELKIEGNYSVYSYKHTGAINLFKATGDLDLVRQHLRHATVAQTAAYLRELGILRSHDALASFPAF